MHASYPQINNNYATCDSFFDVRVALQWLKILIWNSIAIKSLTLFIKYVDEIFIHVETVSWNSFCTFNFIYYFKKYWWNVKHTEE